VDVEWLYIPPPHHYSTRIGQRLGVAWAAVDNWRVSRSKVLCIFPRTNRMLKRNDLRCNIKRSQLEDIEYFVTRGPGGLSISSRKFMIWKIQQWRTQLRVFCKRSRDSSGRIFTSCTAGRQRKQGLAGANYRGLASVKCGSKIK
jgi:hypothetical protein